MLAKTKPCTPMTLGQVRHLHVATVSVLMAHPISGLQFRLNIGMSIAGLPTKHSTATTVTNAACPIELPINAG
jgi:hypothetical protein